MKSIFKKIIFCLILLSYLIFPISVYADTGTSKEPWEIKVSMEVTDGDDAKATINTTGLDSANKADAWNKVFIEYKGIIVGISGVCTLTFVALFIINFMKLGQAAGNPQARSTALNALLWTGIASAGCGGFTLIVGFAYNLFKDK